MNQKMVRITIPFLVAGILLWGIFTLISTPVQAEDKLPSTQVITVVGAWSGTEQENFQAVLDAFTFQTGIPTSYTQTSDLYGLLLNCSVSDTCPDVALVSSLGLVGDLVDQGTLVPLDTIVPDFDTYYSTTWRILSSIGSTLYGVPFKVADKSIIWYRPEAFESITATVPTSWTALLNLNDALVADGQIPFSIGAESGGATGWPLSDWFENILLRVGGPVVHRKLVTHAISWTDPRIVETMQRFSDIVGQNEYQVGGITGTLTTNFIDAIDLVFSTPPSGTMYFEGSWVQTIIADHFPGLIPVDDYNIFPFPEIDPALGTPLMGSVDFAILFHDDADAQSLIQFLATPDAAEIWAARGGFLSANSGVNLNVYPDELCRAQAEQLIAARDFVFDLDDQLPPELQQYEWGALMDFVAHPDQLMGILQGIEDEATELQGPIKKVYFPALAKNLGK